MIEGEITKERSEVRDRAFAPAPSVCARRMLAPLSDASCAPLRRDSQRLKLEEFLNEERSMVSPPHPRRTPRLTTASRLACAHKPFATPQVLMRERVFVRSRSV